MLSTTATIHQANQNFKLDELRKSSAMIEDQLSKDRYAVVLRYQPIDRFPDLHNILQGYKMQQENPEEANRWNFLRADSFRNLPDFMLQQYESMQVSSFMGIFPEINRVWMTIDNCLYLWNYDSTEPEEQLNSHEDPDQIIVSVALVKPVPGVFLEQIEYVLVVSTPLAISLLGIAFADKPKKNQPLGALTIFDCEMTCHAGNVNMSNIVGTKNGRIFMRGNDGQLFELEYQAHESWFSRKVRKTNRSGGGYSVFVPSILTWAINDPIKILALDDERNILYTVTRNNHIELISLGEDGTNFSKISKISNLSDQLNRHFNAFDDTVVSIHPLSVSESDYLHCVAITSSGFRLYFTTLRQRSQYNTKYSTPNTLELKNVLPPAGQSLINQGAKVHEAFYSHGITIASQALEEVDRIMIFAPHPGIISKLQYKSIAEYSSYLEIEGRTWAIVEASSPFLVALSGNKEAIGYTLNELVTQFEYPMRKFYLLTNGGLTCISKMRPVDILLKLITDSAVGDARPFYDFFQSFGADEACAMSLAIACGHSSITTNYVPENSASFASKLFFELGGIPSLRIGQSIANTGGPMGVPMSSTDLCYSSKHNGLFIYASRLLKNIWKQDIVTIKKTPEEKYQILGSKLNNDTLVAVQGNLQALDCFLKQYPKFTAPPTPDTRPPQGDHEAWKIEQQSFANIHDLILRSVEAIAFLSILIDFRIIAIAKSLSKPELSDLHGLTFEMLVVSAKGKSVAKSLMTALVNGQLTKELNVEGTISALQKRCPTICESSDVILYKGMDHLRSAKQFVNQASFSQHLNEALQLFCSVTGHISIEKLKEIIEMFKSLRFFNGIVDLCLLKASEYRSSPEDDISIVNDNLQLRDQCYKLIFDSLETPDFRSNAVGKTISNEDAAKRSALARAIASDDENFHFSLYEWFIEHGWTDQLLEIQSPHLETYLTRGKGNLQISDYLCRYYIRHNQFFNACTLMYEAAHRPDISLSSRLSYLTSAVSHARSIPASSSQEVLNGIQDELDLARIQLELAAQTSSLELSEEVESDLLYINELLFDANALFAFAKKYGFDEITLKILFVSDRGDGRYFALVQQLWSSIIDSIAHNSSNPVEILSDKVVGLGRLFYPDENIFPLQFLISKLEHWSLDRDVSNHWVIRVLLEIRIPFDRIFKVYQELYDSKLPPWSSSKALLFLVQNLCYLVEIWFDYIRSPSATIYDREEFPVRMIDDALSKYLVNVPAPVGNTPSLHLMDKLRMIQSRVRSHF